MWRIRYNYSYHGEQDFTYLIGFVAPFEADDAGLGDEGSSNKTLALLFQDEAAAKDTIQALKTLEWIGTVELEKVTDDEIKALAH